MLKETILKNFPFWDSEKQLEEYQGYKALGDYSPFNDTDYALMEMVMKNPNAEVECMGGICELVDEKSDDELLEEKLNLKELGDSVSILFDSLFDDPDDDDAETKTPKLSKYLKILLNNIKVSDNRKRDLLFNPKVKTLPIQNKIYTMLGGKQHKLEIDTDNQYLKLILPTLSLKPSIKEILTYPIMKLLVAGLQQGNIKTIVNTVFEDPEDIKKVLKIRRIESLITAVRKSVKSIKIRVNKPEQEVNKVNQLNKFKDNLDEILLKYDNIKDKKSDEAKDTLNDIKILQDQIENFDDIYDSVLIKAEKKSGETKVDTSDLIDLVKKKKPSIKDAKDATKFRESIEISASKIIGLEQQNFDKFRVAVKADKTALSFTERQIKNINQILDGSHPAYSKPEFINIHNIVMNLYKFENKGFGKGELFFDSLFTNVEMQGGSSNFDLVTTAGTGKYEIKAYDVTNGSIIANGIRLGKDGKVTGFPPFYKLVGLIDDIQTLFTNNNKQFGIFDIFKTMGDSADNVKLTKLSTLLDTDVGGDTLIGILRSGEVTPTVFVKLKEVLSLTRDIMKSISENDFHYAKLFGRTQNELFAIESRNTKAVSYGEVKKFEIDLLARLIDKDDEESAIKTIDKLLREDFINDDNFLKTTLKEIMNEINSIMREHPMIIVGNTVPIIYGIYEDFVFVKITQGIVRIAPIELAPDPAKELTFQLNQ